MPNDPLPHPGVPADARPRPAAPLPPRLIGLDLARSAALAGMVVYHLVYDLDLLGWLAQGTAVRGYWAIHARVVAGSFIFLAGLSLWLAHGAGVDLRRFGRRLLRISAAAALVSLASWIVRPEFLIFYGILHSIAVSSLLGLAVLRLPALVTLGLAAGIAMLAGVWSHPAFNGALVWTGLATTHPQTADFLPLFPWAAPLLAGVAVGRLISHFDLWHWLAPDNGRLLRAMAWPGQHSLAIYLIHQPVLLGLLIGISRLSAG
jgi:uncharacterized membrane protein